MAGARDDAQRFLAAQRTRRLFIQLNHQAIFTSHDE